MASKAKKIKKTHAKIKIEEVKIYIFWETWWISTKFLGKMWLLMILKVTKKQTFTLSSDSVCVYGNQVVGIQHI